MERTEWIWGGADVQNQQHLVTEQSRGMREMSGWQCYEIGNTKRRSVIRSAFFFSFAIPLKYPRRHVTTRAQKQSCTEVT